MKKSISILIIALVLIMSFTSVTMATTDDIIGGGQNFIETGKTSGLFTFGTDGIENVSDLIYSILLGIAIVTAVALGSFLGLKFIMASPEEKAEVKESLVPFVIGCVIVFSAFGIWKIALSVFSTLD